jgi:uncharacterized protein YkwD
VFRDEAARAILDMVNSERVAAGLSQLRWNEDFSITAKIRSVEITEHFSADHRRPDGSEWHTLINEAGISYSTVGENLAQGGSTQQGGAWYTPQLVMESWMNSPGHRSNILNPDFEVLGVGAYDFEGKRYYVQHFGTLR